jgi:TonB family protein
MKSLFAVSLLLMLAAHPAVQSQPPRDTPPASIENARREQELRATIAGGAATKEIYAELALLLAPQDRFDDLMQVMRGAAALEPASPEPQHRLATFYWDKVRADASLDAVRQLSYVRQGLAAEDRALALKPDYVEALVYKGILLRMQANLSTDPIEQTRLVDEADVLRDRAIAIQRERQAQKGIPVVDTAAGVPFGFAEPFEQATARLRPVRVGGNIRTPSKLKDVKPVYPAIAQAARVQGVVMLEALIDEDGNVANARVLRSIPLLDAAALGAVSQWQFTPTEVDGRRVPVLMTVTVNFTLMG